MRRTLSGFAALGAATLAAQLVGFFVQAVIARRLGAGGLGAFSFALNLAGYFAIPANFGVTAFAVRELAREPERVGEVLGEVAVVQGVLSLLPYAVLVALAPILAVDTVSRGLIPVVGLGFLLDAAAITWVLFALQRFALAAVARLAGALVFAVLVLALLEHPLELGWIHVAGVGTSSLLTLVAVLRTTGRPVVRVGPRALVRRFATGVPFGVAAVMISVYYTVDSLMLGWLRDVGTVGQYAVAYKLPLAVLAFAGLWSAVLTPHASALAAAHRDELREQLGWFTSLSLVGSLPLLAGTLLVGPSLITELFGAPFAPAGTPFVVLMGAAALVLVTINYGTVDVALGDERQFAVAVSLGAGLNVAANLVVIPRFGMTGAAAATVGAEVVVFLYVMVRVHRIIGVPPLERVRIGRAAAATAAMAGVLLLAPSAWAPAARVVLGLAVFTAAGAALRVVRLEELRALRPGTAT